MQIKLSRLDVQGAIFSHPAYKDLLGSLDSFQGTFAITVEDGEYSVLITTEPASKARTTVAAEPKKAEPKLKAKVEAKPEPVATPAPETELEVTDVDVDVTEEVQEPSLNEEDDVPFDVGSSSEEVAVEEVPEPEPAPVQRKSLFAGLNKK